MITLHEIFLDLHHINLERERERERERDNAYISGTYIILYFKIDNEKIFIVIHIVISYTIQYILRTWYTLLLSYLTTCNDQSNQSIVICSQTLHALVQLLCKIVRTGTNTHNWGREDKLKKSVHIHVCEVYTQVHVYLILNQTHQLSSSPSSNHQTSHVQWS